MFPLPADEFEFNGQVSQIAVPDEFLYVPTGHILHCPFDAPVSGPVYPALHGHTIVGKQPASSHDVLVKSTPCSMALTILVLASVLRYSSTTNNPAISAFK
jgi:hypothetical protein